MSSKCMLAAVLLIWQCLQIDGYQRFQNDIPNGAMVPNPCKSGKSWGGAGHISPFGSGPRNPFGVDFAKTSEWPTLCGMDSDTDGRTNGEELGDPNCTWTKKNPTPLVTTGLSHPGICEPVGGSNCSDVNEWFTCADEEFSCPGTEDAATVTMDLRLDNVTVPARETSYVCKVFDVNVSAAMDVMAVTPIYGQSAVVHHMVLYGCAGNDARADTSRGVFDCFMTSETGCTWMITAFGTWEPVRNSMCLGSSLGVRIGPGGYTKLMVQYHWTNSDLRSGQTDDSGVTIYATPRLRQYQAGMFMVGQTYIEIPPGETSVSFSGGCVGGCSNHRIKRPVYVVEIIHHMHALGVAQTVEIHRHSNNTEKVIELSNEPNYNNNKPTFFKFDEPVELLPGDYIKTTCTYNSRDRNSTVFFGQGSADEMCFAFLRFYPLANLPLDEGGCSQWKSVPLCKIYTDTHYNIDGCVIKEFLDPTNEDRKLLFGRVLQSCRPFHHRCLRECRPVYEEAMAHACLRGDIGDYVKYQLSKSADGIKILAALDSCRQMTISEADDDPGQNGGKTLPASSAGISSCIVPSVTYTLIIFVWNVLIVS